VEQSRLDLITVALSGDADSPVLERLLTVAVDLLSVTAAGIVIISDGQHAGAIAVSDTRFAAVDDLQFSLGEGPGVDAAGAARPVLEPDLALSVALWPAFAPAALEIGTNAAFAFPLRIGAVSAGVMMFYRDTAGDLGEANLADAATLAVIATHLLLELEASSEPGAFPSRLTEVVDHRAHVHQATGMISAQLDVDIATALSRLRAFAWSHDRTIDDVANDVVGKILRFHDP
jgi:hypothetical protein